jgi:hypothetical protein
MSDAEDIARRASDISARAARLAEDASDSAALREELDRLDAELARLDAEQQRLDEELREHGTSDANADSTRGHRPEWAERLADIVSDVTERVSSLGGGGWPWNSSETEHRTVPVEGPTDVVVENRSGSVKVVAGAHDTVEVDAELFAPTAALIDEMMLTAAREGDQVVVRCQWPETRRGRRARLTVTVPPGSSVRASSAGGSISVDDTHGPASVATKGGSVSTSGTSGSVDARTAGGSVRVGDHTGDIHASTMGGSVHLGGVLSGTIEATTAGGSVHVDGVDRGTVVASTSGGSINVRGRLVGHSRIRTAGGSVTVSIPGDSQVHIDGKGTGASSDFDELQCSRGRIEGTLGDGHEGTIEFRTSGGNVSLKKT